ncbi:hypothetical protein MNB_SV-5-1741 [hydrothermal vent metagenome]|uniref:AB hydrolase-1 domain-containing protein n=1 Tax=hydrothermal vent metagenome TaxID=652676 RepID=A0A1W1EBL2_9ZZZZ
MKYFNGFSLHNEEEMFKEYIDTNSSTVIGFSFGAQKAFEYVYNSKNRVDRLILLSPAFFQEDKKSFVRSQLRYFEAGQEAYVKQFLLNVTFPSNIDLSKYLNIGTKEELTSLLTYKWDKKKIEDILNRGTIIEVFIGEKDKIINAKDTNDFFKPLTTCYYIKDAGHLLKGKNEH